MPWTDVIDLALERGGLATVPELVAASGIAARTVRARAERERWWHPFPSVVGLPGHPTDGRAWARAAVLHAGGLRPAGCGLVAVAGASALALHGIVRVFPTRVEVAVPAARTVTPHPRLAVRRSRLMRSGDVTSDVGVPVLTGAALLRDLAGRRDLPALRAAAIDLRHAGHLDLSAVARHLARSRSFPGRGRLRQVHAELLTAGRVDSPLELQVRRDLRAAGIELDRGQVRVPGPTPMHLDLGIEAIRFGIEVDSLAHHAGRSDLDRDARRANRLATLTDDWRVLHATWSTITERWEAFVAEVSAVIAAQSARHLGRPWPRERDLQR